MAHVKGRSGLSRNGLTLLVLIIALISTVHQAQVALCKPVIPDRYASPVELHVISGQSSGEILDRREFQHATETAESQRPKEDLARICRCAEAMIFCETCEGANTRFVVIDDDIDTTRAAEPGLAGEPGQTGTNLGTKKQITWDAASTFALASTGYLDSDSGRPSRRKPSSPRRSNLQPAIRPKSGRRIRVLGIAHISGPNQDEKSLADQEALYRSFLDENSRLAVRSGDDRWTRQWRGVGSCGSVKSP